MTYTEYPVKILDTLERNNRSKRIRMCEVLWSHHTEDEAIWEREDELQAEFSQLFASLTAPLLLRAAAGVPPWGKGPRWPIFPFPLPFLPRRLLAVITVPRLAAICLPRSPAPRSKPLNVFPSLLSFSQAKPELKSWPESRFRDSPMIPATAAVARLAGGVQCRHPEPPATPSHPIQIRQPRLDLTGVK
jgi:hypothetical protein